MDICCGNCECSKCKLWKECNDYTHELDYWCFRVPEASIDYCFVSTGSCEYFINDEQQSHPLYNEDTIQEANEYYERLNWKLVYRKTVIS